MKSFVQKHGKLLISVAVALMVAAACMGTLMQNKQTRSLVGAWMIYDGYDGGDLAPNVLVFAADGTGIGYALDSDGLDNGMENILLPRERLSDAQPFHWQQSGNPLIPLSVALLRCVSFTLARMKNSRRIMVHFHQEIV